MDTYFITIRFRSTGDRMQLRFQADNFGHAQEQAEPYLADDGEIISIEKDYDPVAP